MQTAIFLLLLAAAVGGFAWSTRKLAAYLLRGKHTDPWPRFDRVGQRLWDVVVYFLAQKKVGEPVSYTAAAKGITSKHHLIIFWGFLVIQVGAVEMFLHGLHDGWSLSFIGAAPYHALKLVIDWFNVLVLAMIVYGYFRRIVLRPRLIPMNLDAALILFLIGFLMVTHFGHHLFHFATAEGQADVAEGGYGAGSFSALLYGWFLGGVSTSAHFWSEAFWWMHIVTILFFLNYIPYSKHIHLLGALPNIAFRNLDARMIGTKRNLEDENDYGVGKVEQFTWKQLLDGYACTECARCSNFCPAYNTDKPLSPFHLIQDIKHEMMEVGALQLEIAALTKRLGGTADKPVEGPAAAPIEALQKKLADMPPLVGGRIKDDVLWACTTCGACQEVCPVFIEHPRAIVDMRTHLVLTESRMPAELGRTFTNLERNSNPWGIGADKRMDWAEGLAVPTVEENPNAEYLLFVGCAGAFDDRVKKTMKSLVQCLHAAQVSFAVLGLEEQCSGDPARRGGNEYLFQMQAQANVDAMNAAKITKVIASCPHCFHTIKNEYPHFGGKYQVMHHSELLSHLVETKKLVPTEKVADKITFHDSCYLGRWNGVYDAPRKMLKVLPGSTYVDPGRNKEHGFCCGGGGARMFMEEHQGTRVNRNRADELVATGANIAAVACPFCTVMITDGVKDAGADEKVQVLDIAEVLARSLPASAKQGDEAAAPATTEGA